MKNIKALIIGFLLVGAVGLGLGARVAPAAVDDDAGAGQGETPISFSQALTAGTTAVLMTAVTTSTSGDGRARALNVRSITITNTASGFVRLYSTSDNSQGKNLIGAFAVIANTPLPLTVQNLRSGCVTRVGEGIYVDASTGTVSIQASVRQDLKTPKTN